MFNAMPGGDAGHSGGRDFRSSARFVIWMCCRKPDVFEFHEREAARYKRLLANTTTPALKARLAAKAKEREDLAESLEHRENGEARLKRALARS